MGFSLASLNCPCVIRFPGLCCKFLQVQLDVGNGYEHPWLPHRLIVNSHCARSISMLFHRNADNNTTIHHEMFQFSRVSLVLGSRAFRNTRISRYLKYVYWCWWWSPSRCLKWPPTPKHPHVWSWLPILQEMAQDRQKSSRLKGWRSTENCSRKGRQDEESEIQCHMVSNMADIF